MAFTSLVLEVPSADAESLSDALLEAGAWSVACEDAGQRSASERSHLDMAGQGDSLPRARLTALCGAQHDPERLLRCAGEISGVAVRSCELHRIPDEDWVAISRKEFGPIRVSARLWIVPSWHRVPEPGAINLVLDPGLAFGTGSHASTRLCLQWLERSVAGGETVLDYGCGSGILAIAALKFGAARAVGVDIDPEAVAAARENARRNGAACEFLESSSSLTLAADLVVANILANPLKVLAPILVSRCRRGGRIALSGILLEQTDEVRNCYAPWIAFETPAEEDSWVCLSGVRV